MAAPPARVWSKPALRNAVAVALLIAAPLAAFLLVVHRDIPLAPLAGLDVKCAICERKATRTLRRAADDMRAKGLYVYNPREYPGGIPAWCDLHGPDRVRENSASAYVAALSAFALAAAMCRKLA